MRLINILFLWLFCTFFLIVTACKTPLECIEEKMKVLEQKEEELKEKALVIDDLKEKMKKLERVATPKAAPWKTVFDSTKMAGDIQLLDKTMIKKIGLHWKSVLCENDLPTSGIYSVTFKIEEINPSNHAMFGVAAIDTNLDMGAYSQPTGWMYYTHNGYIWNNNKAARAYFTTLGKGDEITVIMDMDNLILSFEVNGVFLGPAYYLRINKQINKLRFAVDLYSASDTVKIIDKE